MRFSRCGGQPLGLTRRNGNGEGHLPKTVHFVGIGGVGMCGAARILLTNGTRVTGSDLVRSANVMTLQNMGAQVWIGHRAENVPPDTELVVTSAAIRNGNAELLEAQRRGIPVLKYAEMLGRLMKGKQGIAVAGTHGKTTTTAMLSSALQRAGFDPTFVVGGDMPGQGGGSNAGTGDIFVAEACEYDRSFLHLSPRVAVVTNVEEDHLDYYSGLDEIVGAFSQFVAKLPEDGLLVVPNSNGTVKRVVASCRCRRTTFGIECGHWKARILANSNGFPIFDVSRGDEAYGRAHLRIPGIHNVLNALAVLAVLDELAVDRRQALEGVSEFPGAKRRFQVVAQLDGVTIVDDYGHHPTEVRATLAAARQVYRDRQIICVFQPHQHSRTRFFMKDFADALAAADQVIVPDIYFARDSESESKSVSSAELAQEIRGRGGKAEYLPSLNHIEAHLARRLRAGDVLITMGAGNIGELGHRLSERLAGAHQA